MPDVMQHVCVGAVAGPHGVAGGVKIKAFTTHPADVAAYGPLSDESGARQFEVTVTGIKASTVLARLSGIADREQAAALKGLRLYVDRGKLPAAETEEFYHADLIGLAAALGDGTPIGEIVAVWDFGAGDTLEIKRPDQASVMVPFTRAVVPVVDLVRRAIVIDPPLGLLQPVEASR